MTRLFTSPMVAEELDLSAAGTWSPERVALLHLHYLQGLAAAESARLIGGVTRNAVISKRYRMGLFGRIPMDRPRLKRIESPAPGGPRYRRLAPREELMSVTPLPAMDWPPPPASRPANLVDRPDRTCAWPLGPAESPGDASTLFCCAPLNWRSHYCEVHRARARRPIVAEPKSTQPGS